MFLTEYELRDLTGLTRPAAQGRWLRRNGWPVVEDARGRPRVLRSVVLARLGGAPNAGHSAGPNWDALHGATKARA